jgi:hypothetical protein
MYILETFAGIDLPTASPKHTAGTAASNEQTVALLGGGTYDAAGTSRLEPQLPYELTYDCKATGATAAALRATLDGLRALRGVKGKLYRRGLDDSVPQFPQWATARLLGLSYNTEARHSHGLFQPLTLTWNVQTLWYGILHGAPWTLDDGYYLDTGLYLDMHDRYALTSASTALTVSNGGNIYTDEVTLTLEAGASAVTGLTVAVGSCVLEFSGTVAAGTSLVIDSAKRSIKNAGVDAYANLQLGSGHASVAWFRLEPGNNTVTVVRTGGGADSYLTLEFSDRWE